VTVKVTDKDGASDSKTFTVTVANVAPTVHLSSANDLSVNEGSTHTYSYTISDPGTDTVSAVSTDCGAHGTPVGSEIHTDTTGSFQCSFPDGPSSSTVSVTATDSDGDTGDLATQTVDVANVAPTVVLTGPADVSEGSTHTYSFTVSDPGQDSFVASAGFPDCDAGATNNGSLVAGSYVATASGGSFKCFFPNGPATANVKMKAADSDGASGTDSESVQVVAVANVAPTVTAPADQTANEGSSTSFDLGSFGDPGPDNPWAVSVDWGDGSSATTFDAASTGTLAAHSHTYADGPATRTVTVTVTDKNGGVDSKTFTVTVANVAPTLHLSAANDLSVGEGSTHTYSYTISDPGTDTVSSVSTDCGAHATKVTGSDTHTDTTGSFQCSFADGPDSSVVSAGATDSDGATGNLDTQSVTINNVAPTVHLSLGNDASVSEGSTHTYSYTISDPGVDTVSSVSTSCGGHGTKVAGSETNTDTAGSFQCSFPDGPNSSTVSASATDSDGAAGSPDTQTVTVANVQPTADLGNNGPKDEGSAATVSFSNESDPSAPDTSGGFHYSIVCNGDATQLAATYGAAGTTASKSCTFADNGTYPVRGRIFDKDGGSNTYTTNVVVNNVAPTITSFTGTDALTGPLAFVSSTFTTNFTDPGSDSWFANFTFSDGSPLTVRSPATGTGFTSGNTIDHTFATAGCNRWAKAKVTDDDGGVSEEKTAYVKVGTGAFLPPLANQPVSDKLKNGQVLPVKVSIADCNGVAVTNLAPVIKLAKGDLTAVADDTAQTITISSVSAADTGTTMRQVDSSYIYNMRVNVPATDLGKDFTILIYPYGTGTPATLRHVIVPIK
jgi:hypothetical protein